MIQRALTFIILLSMTLHCAARLGVLSYLYENRNDIAHTIGLISEVPIALCSSDYDSQKGLHIQDHDHQQSLPVSFLTAHEINLFFQAHLSFSLQEEMNLEADRRCIYAASYYPQPSLAIFQPPRIS